MRTDFSLHVAGRSNRTNAELPSPPGANGCMVTLREWLSDGPFTLALSSSWFGLFCHAGVVCALVENGLAPARISGSSAGALVAVLWAMSMDTARLKEIMERAEERNPIVWASLLSRNMLPGVVNTHKSTRELLHRILEGAPVPDLEDLSIPVLVSAFDVTSMKPKVFSRGNATDALAASMAVPLLFKPVWAHGRPLLDGAVGDVAGVAGIDRAERTLYHHATYLPLWMTQHLSGFSNLVALKIGGLPYLNPWQLSGNGMKAFLRAKAATLRALDTPIARGAMVRSGEEESESESVSDVGEGRDGIGLVRVPSMGGRRRSERHLHSKL